MNGMRSPRRLGLALAAAFVLVACGKSDDKTNEDDGKENPAVADNTAAAEQPAAGSEAETKTDTKVETKADEPPKPTGPRGMAAEGNNPKLVELAKPILECKVDPMYPVNACNDEVKAFNEGFDKAADLPTLVNLLEDPEANVRFLAARVLRSGLLMQEKATREYAMRIAEAAKAETDPATATILGEVLLQGPFADEPYADAMEALFTSHALPQMRAALASNLAAQNGDDPRFIPLMQKRFAEETDKDVKLAIVGAFYTSRDQCEWSLSIMDDPDNDIAGKAAYNICWSSGTCKDHYDAFNEKYAARIKSGNYDSGYVRSTLYMARAKQATDEQKQAFLDTLQLVVQDTKQSGMTRASALETIGEHSKTGKAFAKKFRNDADKWVADAAKKIK